MARLPSSHGSLDGGEAAMPDVATSAAAEEDEDPFDSDEFREFLRHRRERGGRSAEVGSMSARPVAGRGNRRGDDDSDEDRHHRGGGGGQPPEWDGVSQSFQDWLIKCRLWIATTRAKPKAQGPLILQRLSGVPFQAFKHWAKDAAWLGNEQGGTLLLEAMNQPENFGEDREEDLLASLSKVTFHMKRGKDESLRGFWSRWEEALRKVKEHQVLLPDKYLGFLLIQALGLGDAEIKNLLSFTRGSILPTDVREWARKHEMKLMAKDVGIEKEKRTGTSGKASTGAYYVEDEAVPDEIHLIEDALYELQSEDADEYEGDDSQVPEDEILDEHEVAEVLNTMIHRKKTFVQSAKIKKAKELARGYGNWKKSNTSSSGSQGSSNNMSMTGRLRGGNYKMSIEALKATSRCSKCGQVGHWHKDAQCPKNQNKKVTQETHYIERDTGSTNTEEAIFCGFLMDENEVPEDYNVVEPNKFPGGGGGELRLHPGDPLHGPRGLLGGAALHLGQRLPTPDGGNGEHELLPGDRQLSGASLTEPGTALDLNHQDSKLEVPNFDNGPAAFGAYMSDSTLVGKLVGDLGGFDCGVESEAVNREIFWSEGVGNLDPKDPNEDLCGTIDTGCQRMAIGLMTLNRLQQAMPHDLQIGTLRQEYRFKSVHGKSSTSHVATIPTSIGKKGSILKPAIFTGEHSEQAPFLISLPFLMACRTVLHLDPSRGLRAYFKKFGFSVNLHIGPTGALRIPLTGFSQEQLKHLEQVQKEVLESQEEFEVLRTTAFAQAPVPDDVPTRSPVLTESHGLQLASEDRAADMGGSRTCMDAHGAQAALPDGPHDVDAGGTTLSIAY